MNPRRDRAELYQGADGQWYYRVLAGNGEVIADSEGYVAKRDAIDTLEVHFADVPVIELENADD